MTQTPRYVVVELFDDSDIDARECAKEIIDNLDDVKLVYAAYDDGFGRLIRVGEAIEA
jgi:hypothetical protein